MAPRDNPESHSVWKRLKTRLTRQEAPPTDDEIRRLEEKQQALRRATDQWLSLLREMEEQGESGDAAYDRYYRAYLGAKKQQQNMEMVLFNLRHRQAS